MRMKGEIFLLLIIEAQSVMLIMPPSPIYHPLIRPSLILSFSTLYLLCHLAFHCVFSLTYTPATEPQYESTVLLHFLSHIFLYFFFSSCSFNSQSNVHVQSNIPRRLLFFRDTKLPRYRLWYPQGESQAGLDPASKPRQLQNTHNLSYFFLHFHFKNFFFFASGYL